MIRDSVGFTDFGHMRTPILCATCKHPSAVIDFDGATRCTEHEGLHHAFETFPRLLAREAKPRSRRVAVAVAVRRVDGHVFAVGLHGSKKRSARACAPVLRVVGVHFVVSYLLHAEEPVPERCEPKLEPVCLERMQHERRGEGGHCVFADQTFPRLRWVFSSTRGVYDSLEISDHTLSLHAKWRHAWRC